MPPARCTRRNLMDMEPSKLALGNHDGLATDKWVQYELSRKSKDQMRKELNLTSDMLTNVMNVSQKLKEMDICERKREKTQVQIALVLFSIRAFMMGLKRYCILRSLAR